MLRCATPGDSIVLHQAVRQEGNQSPRKQNDKYAIIVNLLPVKQRTRRLVTLPNAILTASHDSLSHDISWQTIWVGYKIYTVPQFVERTEDSPVRSSSEAPSVEHTCDESERGIREIFVPFQGDF